ncbi:MAG TPA: hypothetical protein VES42_21830 [Pilimelia sp.]|nr:hypothetical protein [Pilimelia sp.]
MQRLAERARDVLTVVTRATPVPLAVRCAVFLAGLVAMVLAYPPVILFTRSGVLLLLAPVVPAVAPRGRATTGVALLVVSGWVVATTAYGEPIALWRLLALAAALYLLHSLAALAAVLPYDAFVAPAAVARWVLRAAGVVLAASVLAITALAAAGRAPAVAALAATVVGLAFAVGVAALLAWLARRG